MSYRFLRNTPLCIFEREMQIIPGFDHSENYNCEYVDMLSAIICEMHYANLAQQIIQKIIALEVENLNFKDCGHQKRFNAGYGIRTRELLRDRILSPAPLASLANPATI